jgi:hypothetical protein
MNIGKLSAALQSGQVQGINIITHSGLNRYAVQVLPAGKAPFLLLTDNQKPCFWQSLGQLQATLRRRGIVPPTLKVTVAQDEVIGR